MSRLRHHPGHPLADSKGWVELNDAYWNNLPEVDSCGKPYNNSQHAGFSVISDIMSDTRHMADGKTYNSKSEYRKATRKAGCIEVGNDTSMLQSKVRKSIELDRGQRREAIKQSIYELRNGKRG